MTINLSALPPKLVEIIANGLPPSDLLALRSVWRRLIKKSLRCVDRTFFTTIQTNLSYVSFLKSLHPPVNHQAVETMKPVVF